ncbi:unnamed protein product [Zymoseptoria tritici ST99CH_3D1]|nr:unnamed protein product [Zymoseptoria tritici ST99CH_3D1]
MAKEPKLPGLPSLAISLHYSCECRRRLEAQSIAIGRESANDQPFDAPPSTIQANQVTLPPIGPGLNFGNNDILVTA